MFAVINPELQNLKVNFANFISLSRNLKSAEREIGRKFERDLMKNR
jgi:hypothetical protein